MRLHGEQCTFFYSYIVVCITELCYLCVSVFCVENQKTNIRVCKAMPNLNYDKRPRARRFESPQSNKKTNLLVKIS